MSDNEIRTRVRKFIAGAFGDRQIADDADIFALGLGNSLFAMQLVTFAEKEFGVEIESEDLKIENFRSVQALSAMIEGKLRACLNGSDG